MSANQYFAIIDDARTGPFAIDKLADRGVTGDTAVWCPGMPSWLPANQVPDLAGALALTKAGPPLPEMSASLHDAGAADPRSPLKWSMSFLIGVAMVCLFFLTPVLLESTPDRLISVREAHAKESIRMLFLTALLLVRWKRGSARHGYITGIVFGLIGLVVFLGGI